MQCDRSNPVEFSGTNLILFFVDEKKSVKFFSEILDTCPLFLIFRVILKKLKLLFLYLFFEAGAPVSLLRTCIWIRNQLLVDKEIILFA